MARRIPTLEPDRDAVTQEVCARRYRQLEVRLACACGDIPEAAESVRAVGERLRRDAAKLDDPAERLAMAETAYLSVFKRLPWSSG